MKQTVVFDFDGVIHSYTSGWKGIACISDEPVPGIKDAIDAIREEYQVAVVSTRCNTSEGIIAIKDYLAKNNIVVDIVTKDKLPAICYIDDRAICFDGKASELLLKIKNFVPWNKKPTQKTRLDVFKEHFPDCRINVYGIPTVCPVDLDKTLNLACTDECVECAKDYWLAPAESEEQNNA